MADGARVLDLGELIDLRPMRAVQVIAAVLCAAALFVDGYDIQVMALAVPSLWTQSTRAEAAGAGAYHGAGGHHQGDKFPRLSSQ